MPCNASNTSRGVRHITFRSACIGRQNCRRKADDGRTMGHGCRHHARQMVRARELRQGKGAGLENSVALDFAEQHAEFAPEHVELMPKYKVFGFQRSPRAEQPDQGVPDQPAKRSSMELSTNSEWPVSCFGFAVGTTPQAGGNAPRNEKERIAKNGHSFPAAGPGRSRNARRRQLR